MHTIKQLKQTAGSCGLTNEFIRFFGGSDLRQKQSWINGIQYIVPIGSEDIGFEILPFSQMSISVNDDADSGCDDDDRINEGSPEEFAESWLGEDWWIFDSFEREELIEKKMKEHWEKEEGEEQESQPGPEQESQPEPQPEPEPVNPEPTRREYMPSANEFRPSIPDCAPIPLPEPEPGDDNDDSKEPTEEDRHEATLAKYEANNRAIATELDNYLNGFTPDTWDNWKFVPGIEAEGLEFCIKKDSRAEILITLLSATTNLMMDDVWCGDVNVLATCKISKGITPWNLLNLAMGLDVQIYPEWASLAWVNSHQKVRESNIGLFSELPYRYHPWGIEVNTDLHFDLGFCTAEPEPDLFKRCALSVAKILTDEEMEELREQHEIYDINREFPWFMPSKQKAIFLELQSSYGAFFSGLSPDVYTSDTPNPPWEWIDLGHGWRCCYVPNSKLKEYDVLEIEHDSILVGIDSDTWEDDGEMFIEQQLAAIEGAINKAAKRFDDKHFKQFTLFEEGYAEAV